MDEISKEQFTHGTIWKLLERFTGRGIALVISVVLARLLTPDDYGLIALTTVFTNLTEILIDAGFSTALIRKKDVDDEDYACVFAISSLISVFLYVVLFFAAPLIARYYGRSELVSVLRVMSLVLFIQAFASTRNALVNRNMQFKLLMKCNTIAALVSGCVGIGLAYSGMGVWALVVQRLMQQTIITVLLFLRVRWRPKFVFDYVRFKDLFKFSIGVIGSSLINYFENCVNSLIIGKHYSVADLGYYDKGNVLPEQISLNSFGAMTNVLLPTVSSYQSDIIKVKAVIRKVVSYTAFLILPIMLGMLMVTREVILVLFTDKWLPAAPLMQCICIYYIATPLMLIDIQVFFGLGHSKTRIKTELFRLAFILIGVICCCFVLKLDIKYLALSNAVAVSLGTFITHCEVKKMINYSFSERLKDSYKSILSAIVMCVVLWGIILLLDSCKLSPLVKLLIEVLAGSAVYTIISIAMKNDVLKGMLDIVKSMRR